MLSTTQAKTISIISFLAQKGYKPVRTIGAEHYYVSPFRKETKPSFAVHEGKGSDGEDLWRDFGLGGRDGGDIIELVKMLDNCGFQEALRNLESYYHILPPIQKNVPHSHVLQSNLYPTPSIKVTAVRPLNHFVLLKYLEKDRCISKRIAQLYLKLVWYENQDRKNLFAFGWENESKAYEIRGAGKESFKAVTGRKNLTIYVSATLTENLRAFIFEGMLDYLSVLELKQTTKLDGDVIILNSTMLKHRLLPILEKRNYETIFTFFDNDQAGTEALKYLEEKTEHPDIRPQTFYQLHNDVNEYLQFKRKEQL